mmetsp:Transcript_13891/g.27155  ORF Transcript_13891/g.27155 Transcript_13891/m.27155 type:complete len:414 (-) Transcript_13891:241-1482(-)
MAACVSTSQCNGRQTCKPEGVCGCSVTYARQGENCEIFTNQSLWSAVACIVFGLTSFLLACWALDTVRLVVFRRKKGFEFSTSLLSFLTALAGLVVWINNALHSMYPVYPSDSATWTTLHQTLLAVYATLLVSSAYNLSLMWVEFVIASKRLWPVGSNLRHTAKFLICYMIGFAVVALTAVILSILVNRRFFTAWILSTYASTILLMIMLTVGSVKLGKVLEREATRAADVARHTTTNLTITKQLRLCERLRARAENILQTSRRIRAACICYMLSTLAKIICEQWSAPTGVQWLAVACLSLSLEAINLFNINCLRTSMQIDAWHREAHPSKYGQSQNAGSEQAQDGSVNGARLAKDHLIDLNNQTGRANNASVADAGAAATERNHASLDESTVSERGSTSVQPARAADALLIA